MFCHQQYLTHLKSGNSKVLLPTCHNLISIAQFFLLFFHPTAVFHFLSGKTVITMFYITEAHIHVLPAQYCRSGSSDSAADCSSIRSFTVNAGNKSKFPKYSFLTITNEGTITSYPFWTWYMHILIITNMLFLLYFWYKLINYEKASVITDNNTMFV